MHAGFGIKFVSLKIVVVMFTCTFNEEIMMIFYIILTWQSLFSLSFRAKKKTTQFCRITMCLLHVALKKFPEAGRNTIRI